MVNKMSTPSEPSIGEIRVRVAFNVSNSDIVFQIKSKTAELINLCDSLKVNNHHERNRLVAMAMTDYETAAMLAVKAATA